MACRCKTQQKERKHNNISQNTTTYEKNKRENPIAFHKTHSQKKTQQDWQVVPAERHVLVLTYLVSHLLTYLVRAPYSVVFEYRCVM